MINLLPPELKHRYHLYSRLYSLTIMYIFVLVLLGLGAAALATYNFTQSISVASKQSQADQLAQNQKKYQALATQAAFIQDRLSVNKLFTETNDWSALLNSLAPATPDGVKLTTVKASVATDRSVSLILTGQTADRRLIILFNDKLAANTLFTDPQISAIDDQSSNNQKQFTFTITTKLANQPTTKK